MSKILPKSIVASISSNIALLLLKKSLKEGKTIEIPDSKIEDNDVPKKA